MTDQPDKPDPPQTDDDLTAFERIVAAYEQTTATPKEADRADEDPKR